MFRYLSLVIVLAVAGCQTDQPTLEQRRAAADAQQDQKCRSFGAKPGTSDYIRCRETLYSQAMTEEAQRRNVAAGMMFRRQQSSPAYQMNTLRPVNCTSMRNGVMINTTCY